MDLIVFSRALKEREDIASQQHMEPLLKLITFQTTREALINTKTLR